jgi:hypothetical protein
MLSLMNLDYQTYFSGRSVNSGGDGRVWLGFLEFIDDCWHKPAPTDPIGVKCELTRSIESADLHPPALWTLPIVMIVVRAWH